MAISSRHLLAPPLGGVAFPHLQLIEDNGNVNGNAVNSSPVTAVIKGKKKAGGARLWMRFDRCGNSELFECDKNSIIRRAAVPSRDLRVLGPVFSHTSNILAREKAMVVNLEFIRAIVTPEEILILDPLQQEVIHFVDCLRRQLSFKGPFSVSREREEHGGLQGNEAVEGFHNELSFEFQVLETALEVVCTYLDLSVTNLEKDAYPVLDELARNVSTKNLECVRNLKSNLTRLLARVQKVRDEIEHLLDDDENMADLYLTRKWVHNMASAPHHQSPQGSNRSSSLVTLTSNYFYHNDVEDLEMLLESYFMQLDGTRNKILSVREYVDDTEDYVNIQLDNQRNELIQLQLVLTIASFAIAVETLIAGVFGMNIPCELYSIDGIFNHFVVAISGASLALFLLVLGYARWANLLGP